MTNSRLEDVCTVIPTVEKPSKTIFATHTYRCFLRIFHRESPTLHLLLATGQSTQTIPFFKVLYTFVCIVVTYKTTNSYDFNIFLFHFYL